MLSWNAVVFMISLTFNYCSNEESESTKLSSVYFRESLLNINDHYEAFSLWHTHHEKEAIYSIKSDEGVIRYNIFKSNLLKMIKRNAELAGMKLAPGPFSDLTIEEYRSRIIKSKRSIPKINKNHTSLKHFLLRSDNTWENKHKIKAKPINTKNEDWSLYFPKIKDQGPCGSCWAFGTITSLEGRLSMINKKYMELSPQHLVDCSTKDEGCDGGFYDTAFEFILDNGVYTEKEYPYDGKKHECYAKQHKSIKLNRLLYCSNSDEDLDFHCNFGLAEKCKEFLQWSPLATGVDASSFEFQHYSSGEFTGYCSEINHVVVITHITNEHIKILNSWSQKWGENGYMTIKRDKDNQSCFTESQCMAAIDDS